MKSYKNNLAILAGNALDHYDTHIYVLLTPFIAQSIFPNESSIMGLIKANGIGLVGIFTRPLGAILFGKLASIIGPLNALRYSLIGIALSTFTIGILPNYDQIGILAPILLLILRTAQGIFASGEGAIAGFYLISANKNRRSFFSSLYGLSTLLGMLLATGAAYIISLSDKPELYWRWGFILGFFTSIVAYYIRQNNEEPAKIQKPENNNIITSIKQHYNIILRIFILCGFSYLTYPMAFTIPNTLWPAVNITPISQSLKIYSYLVIFDGIVIIAAGYYLKFVKIEKFMPFCVIMLMILESSMFMLMNSASFIEINILRLLIIAFGVSFSIALKIWVVKIIDRYEHEKYLINSIGGAFGIEILGRPFLPYCLYIFHHYGNFHLCIVYTVLIGLAAIFALSYADDNTTKNI